MRGLLKSVVEGGTAEGSSLATFEVAGKTGTAKVARNGHYVKGAYEASFVGMFPADAPQIVILVKLDNPRTSIYGGKAAAPVSRTVLEAAIAARDAALDRRGLASAPATRGAIAAGRPRPRQAEADSIVTRGDRSAGERAVRIPPRRHPSAARRVVRRRARSRRARAVAAPRRVRAASRGLSRGRGARHRRLLCGRRPAGPCPAHVTAGAPAPVRRDVVAAAPRRRARRGRLCSSARRAAAACHRHHGRQPRRGAGRAVRRGARLGARRPRLPRCGRPRRRRRWRSSRIRRARRCPRSS